MSLPRLHRLPHSPALPPHCSHAGSYPDHLTRYRILSLPLTFLSAKMQSTLKASLLLLLTLLRLLPRPALPRRPSGGFCMANSASTALSSRLSIRHHSGANAQAARPRARASAKEGLLLERCQLVLRQQHFSSLLVLRWDRSSQIDPASKSWHSRVAARRRGLPSRA